MSRLISLLRPVGCFWVESLVRLPWMVRQFSIKKITLTDLCCLGFAGGVAKGTSSINSDPESKKRIETAFRRFRADVLRKQADALDKGQHDYSLI